MNRILRYLAQFQECNHDILFKVVYTEQTQVAGGYYTITIYIPGTGDDYTPGPTFNISSDSLFQANFQTYFIDKLAFEYYTYEEEGV